MSTTPIRALCVIGLLCSTAFAQTLQMKPAESPFKDKIVESYSDASDPITHQPRVLHWGDLKPSDFGPSLINFNDSGLCRRCVALFGGGRSQGRDGARQRHNDSNASRPSCTRGGPQGASLAVSAQGPSEWRRRRPGVRLFLRFPVQLLDAPAEAGVARRTRLHDLVTRQLRLASKRATQSPLASLYRQRKRHKVRARLLRSQVLRQQHGKVHEPGLECASRACFVREARQSAVTQSLQLRRHCLCSTTNVRTHFAVAFASC